MTCLYCGKEFETSRLTARYCSSECKKAAERERNNRPPKERNKTSGGRVCANCGASIDHLSPRARYCGGACKQESYRKRKERKTITA